MTLDLTNASWRKSTRSATNGQCVEVAEVASTVAVRDSKHAVGSDYPVLTLAPLAWAGFLADVRSGRLDG